MTSFNLDEVTKALQGAAVKTEEESGVSFEGKNLKLNTADDAKPIVDAILACKQLGYLNLAGNTLGVDAAAALAKALEKHPEFKRALWKDLFTGRLKEEIPKALEHLGNGLVTADARLTELDLSDNAFGPIGVAGLASLLRSRACFALHALRLNNNGLGIGGGRMLAKALTDCLEGSRKQGTPLALKVFIAGRNRLENEGAKALAKVFEQIGTFEEIAMPQNGIYHVGITALSEAFSKNTNLQVLNLNDNTVGSKGSRELAKALTNLQKLRCLNLGDCLLKNRGAELIAGALSRGHGLLEEVNLEANEIRADGGAAIARALSSKPNLSRVFLDGNQFGSAARDKIRQILEDAGHGEALPEFEDDESDASEVQEDDENAVTDEDEVEDEEVDEMAEEAARPQEEAARPQEEAVKPQENVVKPQENVVKPQENVIKPQENIVKPQENVFRSQENINKPQKDVIRPQEEIVIVENITKNIVTVEEFLKTPSPDNFMALGNDKMNLLMKAATSSSDTETFLDCYIPVLMKVGALAACPRPEVSQTALSVADSLYRELFAWAQRTEQNSALNNSLLVHLGLIKSEDKKFKPQWNVNGCFLALESVLKQHYFPLHTKDTLKVFMGRCNEDVNPTLKTKLISALNN